MGGGGLPFDQETAMCISGNNFANGVVHVFVQSHGNKKQSTKLNFNQTTIR